MLNSRTVKSNIGFCYTLFNAETDPIKKQFLMNMALLELCGWIESSLDDIYSMKICLGQPDILKKQIDKTYSFNYNTIKEVISLCLGAHKTHILGIKLTSKYGEDFMRFKCAINDLQKYRNISAHSNADAGQSQIGFTTLNSYFRIIRHGLIFLEKELKKELDNM